MREEIEEVLKWARVSKEERNLISDKIIQLPSIKKLEKIREYCEQLEDEENWLDNDDRYLSIGANSTKRHILSIVNQP